MRFGALPLKLCVCSSVCAAVDQIKISKVFHGLLGKKVVNWPSLPAHKECTAKVNIMVHVVELPYAHTKSEKKSSRNSLFCIGR